jgi:hypothetical protein
MNADSDEDAPAEESDHESEEDPNRETTTGDIAPAA